MLLKSSVILFVVLSQLGCVVVYPGYTQPQANFKIEAGSNEDKSKALDIIHQMLVSKSFQLQPNDWKEWTNILDPRELALHKQQRIYMKGKFKIYYGRSYFQDPVPFINFDFLEEGGRQFSEEGISFYYNLHQEISTLGLTHMENPAIEKHAARVPEQFNEENPALTSAEKFRYAGFALITMAVYSLLVFLPVWSSLRNLANRKIKSVAGKRTLIVVVSSLFFNPMPFPLSIMGPSILVPGIITIPIAFTSNEFLQLSLASVAGTVLVSLIASAFLIKAPKPDVID